MEETREKSHTKAAPKIKLGTKSSHAAYFMPMLESFAERGNLFFQQAQKRAFTAAGSAAEQNKLPRLHLHIHAAERGLITAGVLKGQIFNFNNCHFISSDRSNASGKRHISAHKSGTGMLIFNSRS